MMSNKTYEPVSSRIEFPEVEQKILKFWQANKTFEKSLKGTAGKPEYVFFDGPPFATGMPHYGHLLAGTIKDIVPRYHAMRGHFVDRRFGWDCHGLPVEYEVEQDLKISGKTEIEKMGVGVFNEKCRSIVLRYTKEWQTVVTRMGRWVDFDRDYKTMDPKYMESIWWVFKSLWEKSLIYEGRKILPYCPRCSTPLSNFETNQGYKDVTGPAITVRFKLLDEDNAYILAWTTTPWTLPSNVALAVGKDITYLKVLDKGVCYYLAKERVAFYYKDSTQYELIAELKGSDLEGRKYEPLFGYFAELAEKGAFRVCTGDFVSTEDGSGVVHIAPAFGEDDYQLSQKCKLPVVCPVDEEGKFTAEIKGYAGREVKAADQDIIRQLKAEMKLVHRGDITHSYPHCWRCDTPLIYKAISTWFVKVEQIKDRLIAANQQIRWVPGHLKDGRFGKWLEGARDWAISRNRYWGTPLPIWKSEDGKEMLCVGSMQELEQLSGQKITDLHKHKIDDIIIKSPKTGVPMKRITEVLDCWFESGSMPYAQAHYPFENKEHFESHFPADFIAEGLDQTRGWFYTLMVLSVALFDKPAFKNVIVNGLVLAEDGRKMSKRLKNYPDPVKVIDTYGADALRLYLVDSPVVRAEDLCFSEEGVKQLMRSLLIPLWNVYSFFVTYANIDGWKCDQSDISDFKPENVLDKWILSSLDTLIIDVTEAMDAYDLQRAIRPFVQFIDGLTNWYVRRSRRRFWKSQDDDDKKQAYRTLYHVLMQLSKISAPFIPMVSEAIYQNLRTVDLPESVHLCQFPVVENKLQDRELEVAMSEIMTIVELGRQLRADNNLKVRQPLAIIHVVSRDAAMLARASKYADIILDELNIKKVETSGHETSMADLRGKADFKKIGPRFGAKVKQVAGVIAKLSAEQLEILASGGSINVDIGGTLESILSNEVIIERLPKQGFVVAAQGSIIVAIETKLDASLIMEGLAREFVNKLQSMRKTADMEVTDRICVLYNADSDVKVAVEGFGSYIQTETLCVTCKTIDTSDASFTEWDVNGHKCLIKIEKAG